MLDYAFRHFLALTSKKGDYSGASLFDKGVPYKVWPLPTDYDYNFHVNHAKYFQYGEVARFKLMQSTNFLPTMVKQGIKPMVLAQKATYRREIKLGQPITVNTTIVGQDDKSFFLKHALICKSAIHAIIHVRVALWKKDRFLPPETFYKMIGIDSIEHLNLDNPLVDQWVHIENQILSEIKLAQ